MQAKGWRAQLRQMQRTRRGRELVSGTGGQPADHPPLGEGLVTTEEQRAANRERMRRWRAEHPGYAAEAMRRWRAAHPDYRPDPERERERARRDRAADPERAREMERERKRRARAADPERYREIQRRWLAANPERAADLGRAGAARYGQRLRDAVFDHYGRECACCGATERLTIDHIAGDGREHRRALFGEQRSGRDMHAWLKRQGFPEGFQTLCLACNRSKGTGDRCELDHASAARAAELRRRRQVSARYGQRLRDAVFDHYGRECACCGATERLTIDHIAGDGREHRRARQAGTAMYVWLRRQGFPEGFQTLCLACNRSKGTGDRCRLNHTKAA